MLVESGEWRLGTLTDESSNEYHLEHIPSKFKVTFDSVEVQQQSRYHRTYHLYGHGHVVGVFSDSRNLPDEISVKLHSISFVEV